jgi:hypothetical protein
MTIMASAALAQQPPSTANPNGFVPNSPSGAQAVQPKRAISQDEVRQDLQQAGFNNIEFESAYVVRATNSNGDKLVMTITPDSVRAVEVSAARASDTAEQGSSLEAPNSDAGISSQSGNKNGLGAASSGTQANSQNSQEGGGAREDSAKIPGKSGGESGPGGDATRRVQSVAGSLARTALIVRRIRPFPYAPLPLPM